MGRGTKHKADWKETTLQVVVDARRRLRRLAHKIHRGDAEAEILDESYRCVRACMEKGNSRRLLRRMDDFVEQLKKGN